MERTMSTNTTVTCLRSPGSAGAAAGPSGRPHVEQNRAPARFPAPHGHTGATSFPHASQKRASGGRSARQFGQAGRAPATEEGLDRDTAGRRSGRYGASVGKAYEPGRSRTTRRVSALAERVLQRGLERVEPPGEAELARARGDRALALGDDLRHLPVERADREGGDGR